MTFKRIPFLVACLAILAPATAAQEAGNETMEEPAGNETTPQAGNGTEPGAANDTTDGGDGAGADNATAGGGDVDDAPAPAAPVSDDVPEEAAGESLSWGAMAAVVFVLLLSLVVGLVARGGRR